MEVIICQGNKDLHLKIWCQALAALKGKLNM